MDKKLCNSPPNNIMWMRLSKYYATTPSSIASNTTTSSSPKITRLVQRRRRQNTSAISSCSLGSGAWDLECNNAPIYRSFRLSFVAYCGFKVSNRVCCCAFYLFIYLFIYLFLLLLLLFLYNSRHPSSRRQTSASITHHLAFITVGR